MHNRACIDAVVIRSPTVQKHSKLKALRFLFPCATAYLHRRNCFLVSQNTHLVRHPLSENHHALYLSPWLRPLLPLFNALQPTLNSPLRWLRRFERNAFSLVKPMKLLTFPFATRYKY